MVLNDKKNIESEGNELGTGDLIELLTNPHDDDSDNESDDEDARSIDQIDDEEQDDTDIDISDQKLKDMIGGVRWIVKFFKRSALRNEVLQKIVLRNLKKQLELLLDCKTRWDSLVVMLERFLELFPFVKEALTKLGHASKLDTIEIIVLNNLVAALKPIRVVVEILSSNQMNVKGSDIILEKLLNKLENQSSNIGRQLYDSVRYRIQERRNEIVASILLYLSSPNEYKKKKTESKLSYLPKTQIIEESKKLLSRLFPQGEVHDSTDDSTLSASSLNNNEFDDDTDFRKYCELALNNESLERRTVQQDISNLKKRF